MPQKEIAEILLESDENIITVEKIKQRLGNTVSKGSVSNDIKRIAEEVDSNYSEWRYKTGSYRVDRIQEYDQEIKESYGFNGNPEKVRDELEELGLI